MTSMNENSRLYAFLRCVFGLGFVLQGVVQTDYVGSKLFPASNEYCVSSIFELAFVALCTVCFALTMLL